MSDQRDAPEGFYFVHSCRRHEDFDDWAHCDGEYIWAASGAEALSRFVQGPLAYDGPQIPTADREPGGDKHRAVLGDRVPLHGDTRVEALRFLRDVGLSEIEGKCCEACDLGYFEKIPESRVCGNCMRCVECAATHTGYGEDGDKPCGECLSEVAEYVQEGGLSR